MTLHFANAQHVTSPFSEALPDTGKGGAWISLLPPKNTESFSGNSGSAVLSLLITNPHVNAFPLLVKLCASAL